MVQRALGVYIAAMATLTDEAIRFGLHMNFMYERKLSVACASLLFRLLRIILLFSFLNDVTWFVTLRSRSSIHETPYIRAHSTPRLHCQNLWYHR